MRPPFDRLKGEARSDLARLSNDDFLDKRLFRETPYAFRRSVQAFQVLRSRLAESLGLQPEAIVVCGSAAAGVSLSPTKRLRPFGPHSDLDVAVVSADRFEIAWAWMRQARLSPALTTIQRELIRDHMERLVFFQTIACDRNLQEFPFGRQWFSAFEEARGSGLVAGREIKARIYRNHDALRVYAITGLDELRKMMGIDEERDGR